MIKLTDLMKEDNTLSVVKGSEWKRKEIVARSFLGNKRLADAYMHMNRLINTGALSNWARDLRQVMVSLDHDLFNQLTKKYSKEDFEKFWELLT